MKPPPDFIVKGCFQNRMGGWIVTYAVDGRTRSIASAARLEPGQRFVIRNAEAVRE